MRLVKMTTILIVLLFTIPSTVFGYSNPVNFLRNMAFLYRNEETIVTKTIGHSDSITSIVASDDGDFEKLGYSDYKLTTKKGCILNIRVEKAEKKEETTLGLEFEKTYPHLSDARKVTIKSVSSCKK